MATATVIRPEAGPTSGQSPFIPGVQPPEPFTLVIFGATGDLAARKLLPALYGLWQGRFLPENFVIVGVARRGIAWGDAARRLAGCSSQSMTWFG